jgi:hypothetical protein
MTTLDDLIILFFIACLYLLNPSGPFLRIGQNEKIPKFIHRHLGHLQSKKTSGFRLFLRECSVFSVKHH